MGSPTDALSFSTKFLQSSDKRVILQNENGPCPLLAIWNALILKGELTLPSGAVDSSILQHTLVGKIMDMHGESQDSNLQLQIAETIDLVMKGRFIEGLDVNPKFGSVSGFEFTSEMNVFDLCNVRLLHGWIVDEDGGPAMARLAKMSYNGATEIVCSSLADDRVVQNLRSSLSGSQRKQLESLSLGSTSRAHTDILDSLISPAVPKQSSPAPFAPLPDSEAPEATTPRDTSPDAEGVSGQVHEVMNDMIERVSCLSMSEMDPLASQHETPAPISPVAAASTPQRSAVDTFSQSELMAIAQFIQDSQSQLTITGLFQLTEQMRSGEHAVLFRNNHFSTLYKHTDGHLYCLVTDEGYRGEEGVAWEKLDNEKGDTCYVSSSFEPYSVFKKRQQEEQEEVIRQIRLSEQAAADAQAGAAAASRQAAPWYHGQAPDVRGAYAAAPPPAAVHVAVPAAPVVPMAHTSHDADYALALRLEEQEHAAAEHAQQAQQGSAAHDPSGHGGQAMHQMQHSRYEGSPGRQASGPYRAGSTSGRSRGQFTAARQDGPVYVEPARKSKSSSSSCSIM